MLLLNLMFHHVNPAVLGKKAGAPGGEQPSAKKKKGEEEEDTDSPLKANDKKQQRFKDEISLKLLKWNFKVFYMGRTG